MHDLPHGPALLALARDVLVNDLLPLLPAERRLDARLVANCIAVAEREAGADLTARPDFSRAGVFLRTRTPLTLPRRRRGSPSAARGVRVRPINCAASPASCASAPSRIRLSARPMPALFCGG